jgi:hypothetical protein
MIKEFLTQMKEVTPRKLTTYEMMVKYSAEAVKAFDGYVDLLRDSESFPNQEVNKLVTLMWRLIGGKKILSAIDPSGTIPSVAFTIIGQEAGPHQGVVFIPQTFLSIVANNPEMLVGGFAFTASQCRDYFAGKLPAKNQTELDNSLYRSYAFEVEALMTLQKLTAQAEVKLNLPDFQQKLMEKYPQGLASLPQGINYPTAEYTRSDASPFDSSQN